MIAIIDIASGQRCDMSAACTSNATEFYEMFLAREDEVFKEKREKGDARYIGITKHDDSGKLNKRIWRYLSRWNLPSHWKTNSANALRVGSLAVLSTSIQALNVAYWQSTRQAFCKNDDGTGQACMSWSESIQAFKVTFALQVLQDAQNAFGGEAVSAIEYNGAFSDSLPNKPPGVGGSKKKRAEVCNVCISNRPNGCN